MAIIDELGLEVKVLIRGRPCLEYEDDSLFRNFDDIDQHTLACYRWVESQQDEVFAMYFRVLPGGPASTWLQEEDNGVAFSTSFDGSNAVENYIAYRDSPSGTQQGIVRWQDDLIQPFRFAAISTGK